MSKIRQTNQTWYAINREQFLQNKKNDYQLYYKYYYKIRVLLKKYPEVVIHDTILNMKIESNDDYKKKYILIKEIIDTYVIKKIETNIIETPYEGKRRTYKKQILTN